MREKGNRRKWCWHHIASNGARRQVDNSGTNMVRGKGKKNEEKKRKEKKMKESGEWVAIQWKKKCFCGEKEVEEEKENLKK